jgi:Spy/CpxP family protein refolding chaperone
MKKCYLYSFLLALLLCGAQSQGQTTPPPAHADDPIAQMLFPPELVMKYHNEIGVDESQSKAIKDAIQKAQSRFLDLQWEMQSQAEKLAQLLKARPVDEAAVDAQLDRVLNVEREIKKTQIALLVRIKNQLTEAQQNKLTELRRQSR